MIQINDNEYFKLYACCIPVKGAKRSTICDLQRNTFIYISNNIYDLFDTNNNILSSMPSLEKELVKVLDYLVKNEMGFITDEPNKFSALDLSNNDYPEILKNVIVDFDKNSNHNISSISSQLSKLRCSALELRFFDPISKPKFEMILSQFDKSSVRSLHVVLHNSEWTTKENLNNFCADYKRLKQIIVHSSETKSIDKVDLQTVIIYTEQRINDESHCGNISPHYFQANVDFYAETLKVNNCLDKKIGIDKNGYIKNCPSMQTTFGHVNEVLLKDVLDLKEFKYLGNIKKDEIEICKDCEFRYICLDCRAYVENSDDIFSKPKKCNYDPYSSSWH